jgi:hypothetical protein
MNKKKIEGQEPEPEIFSEKERAKEDLKWGCLPWVLIILGASLVLTPFIPLGIILICVGAGMGGFGMAKGK